MGRQFRDSDAHASRGTMTIRFVEGDWLLWGASCGLAEARAALLRGESDDFKL